MPCPLARLLCASLLLGGCGRESGLGERAAEVERERIADTWIEFSSPEGGFTARFPAAPKQETLQQQDAVLGPIPKHKFTAADDHMTFMAVVSDYPAEFTARKTLAERLDLTVRAATESVSGSLLEEKHIQHQGYPARRLRLKPSGAGGSQELSVRVFWVDRREYQLAVVYHTRHAGSATISRFFDTFRLQK
jgi:hypothetical protein